MNATEKAALVTGGNRGLGLECCRQLAAAGCHVFLAARTLSSAQEAEKGIHGGAITPIELDVTSDASVSAAAIALAALAPRLDILINNAGIYPENDDRTTELSPAALSLVLETNVVGVHRVTRAFLPLLKAAPAARIVNVSSGLGSFAYCAESEGDFASYIGTGYGTSKAALNMLTATWAKALAGTGIKINAVSPGWCRTDMGGDGAPRSAAQGAATLLEYAFLRKDGPNGRFLGGDGEMPW